MTDDFEGRLVEEASVLERERSEKEGLIAEFEETRRQLEEDVDREIEELKVIETQCFFGLCPDLYIYTYMNTCIHVYMYIYT